MQSARIMEKLEISFLRHGNTIANTIGIYQGQLDFELSPQGISETREKARGFDASEYDIVFCSPLKRARQTAEILMPERKDIIFDPRLMERNLGILENTKIDEETKSKLFNTQFTPQGAESLEEMDKRVRGFVDYLSERYEGKKILVITHAGLMNSVQRVFGLEKRFMKNLEILKVVV